jgi:RHS repeat-associated protein
VKGKAASAHLKRMLMAVGLAAGLLAAPLLEGPSEAFAAWAAAHPLPGQASGRNAAPVKLPASSGEPAAKQPKKLSVGEQADRRTRYSSTRYNADHTFTTTISGHPVNYRVRNGGWEAIDSTLVSTKEKGYTYQNRANSFQTLFKDQLGDDYLGLMIDGQMVTMTLQGASKTKATAKGSTVRYEGALPHVDATYNVLSEGLEEVLTLKDGQAPASFQFLLKAPKGTTASQQPDGSWVFFLPGRTPGSFSLKAPMAYDSGSKSGNASQPHSQMNVKQGNDGFEVSLSVDQLWLKDPLQKFPVFVDPSFTIQPDSQDAYFDNNCSSCSGYTGQRLKIGTFQALVGGQTVNYTYRAAVQFDLSAIPAGASISSAILSLFWDQGTLGPGITSLPIQPRRITAAWSPSSMSSQIQFDKTALDSFSLEPGAAPEWMTWNLASTVNSWVSGTQPNYGIYLMLGQEKTNQGGPLPPSMSFPDSAETPQLNVTYGGDAVTLSQPSVLHANGAELSWSQYTGPSGAAFQKYEVHRSQSKGFTPSSSTLLTTFSDVTATSYRDTTAAPNGTFYYAVVANSSKSNEVKVTLPADGQSSMTLQSGSATFIGYSTTSTNCANYGADQSLKVGSDSSDIYRSLIRFDLHALPANASSISAKLNVADNHNNTQTLTLHAYPVTASWDDGTGLTSAPTCTGDGATWYERTGGVTWSSQGGDFDSQTASSAVTVNGGGGILLDGFDVSAIVSKWASGQSPNQGFIIKADSESLVNGNFTTLASDDYSLVTGNRPTLQVTCTDGSHATPPTVAVSAPAPSSMVSGSTVTLSAAASSPGAVSKVQFFVDGSSVGSASQAPWQVTWNSASVGNGSHTIMATATDSAGNSATSAGDTVTVNNYPLPTTAITAPANNAGVTGTVTVNTTNTVASGLTVSKVELYVDGALYATSTASPWSFGWNTLDPTLPSFDGSHTLISKVYDSSGLIVSSSPITVTVGNTAGTLDQAALSSSAVPQAMSFDPSASSQLTYPVNVTITNISGQAWNSATTTLRYRWYLAGSTTSFTDSADVASLGLAAGQTQTTQVNISPPTLPDGMDAARFVLRFDLVDSSGSTPAFFADKGNPPLDNPVIVNKVLKDNIGLEHFWQFTSQPVGAGMTHMTNVANGNSLLTFTPLSEPGRGLSTAVRLIYNSLEEHSDSPAGNNFSLSISGLSRFGDPIDIHPNNADTIAGRSNKFINVVDGTGRLLTFQGVTNPDGTTSWFEPPGVHLFLRSVTTDTTNPKFWAITRPDRVTFWYNSSGFPTFVTDKNGNTLSFTLSAVQPGDDPGGPKFHVTQVTDAAGQGSNPAPNRSFNINYFTKATARKPQIRGKIASITDHLNHEFDFSYYDDGNLLSITEQGGSNADGSFLASRSWIFTYTTSDGSGPAIPNASDRVNPDPKTPNESTKIFSVRDPNGNETLFTYNGPTSSIDRWKLASVQDRAGNLTNFSYDNVNQVTTVAQPTPSGQMSRTYKYAYDVQGRPTQITDPLSQNTSLQWSPDNALTKLTEPNGNTRQFTYNDNGYPTDTFDQLGDHTVLTYQNVQADANDISAHWNPNGGANGTGRTIPHLSQLATKQDPKEVAAGTQNLWSFGYDGNGNLTSVTEPLFPNNPATTTYNADGTVANSKDFLGNQTTYLSYDANGLPTKIADATDSPTAPTHPLQIGYDAGGRTLFIQDENHAQFSGGTAPNYQTQFFYDSFNRLGRQSTPKSTGLYPGTLVWSDLSYDPNNNVLSVVAPHCVPQENCTNETAKDIGTGDTTTTNYDVLDRKVLITDPSGNKTAYAYDVAGRLTQLTLPMGVQNGTPNNTRTVNYGYDALDRTTTQTQNHVNPDNSVSALNTLACYDSVSNLVSVTAPKANLSSISCPGTTATPFTTVYAYDAAHRLTSTTDPLTADQAHHQTQYVYDQNGNRTQVTDANLNTTSFSYDALNRLTQTSQPFILSTPITPAHPVVSQTVYDADGNVVQSFSPRAVDCALVPACEPSGTNNYVTTNHYDQLNRLIRVDLPINSTDGIVADATQYYIHRSYDHNGNLLTVSLPTTQSDPTQVSPGAQTVNVYFDPGWISSSQVGTNSLIRYDYNGKGQQTCRRPALPCTASTPNTVLWSYRPDGRLLSRSDQQGQPVSYVYDADGNLVSSHDASGITDPNQSPIDTQNVYDDLDRLLRGDLKPESTTTVSVPNWTFSSFAYDLNGNVTDQDQNGLEQNGSNGLPNGVVVKDGHKLHSDYDQANWLTDQIDSTLNQQVNNTFTPIGLESSREIDQITGPGSFNLKQKTAWNYFANGKLSTLTTTVPSQTPCSTPCTTTQTIESHTVSYLDSNPKFAGTYGVYVDGNRTQDQYSLRPGGGASSPCFPATCTASYGYDPRDRLVSNNDGHGNQTSYTLDGAGNIQTQVVQNGTTTTTTSNTYDPNNLVQLQKSVSGSQTFLYWYDSLGRQQCVTDSGGSQANCNPSEGVSASKDLLQDYKYDYLDRLQTYRTYSGGGSPTDEADYVYDALNRTVQETEVHPGFNGDKHITQFSYLGLGGLETEEQQTSKNSGNTLHLKDFTYDVYGHRLSMTDTPYSNGVAGTPTTSTYGYDVHGSVSQLVDSSGSTTESYGYTPYGQSDSQLTQLSPGNTDKTTPLNPFRFSAKRADTASGSLDMGVRRFGPDTSHFLTPDFFYGSLADLSLSIDPLTDNRYDLAGGNPISFKEWDGHMALADGGGGASTTPSTQGAAGIFSTVTPTTVRDSQDGSDRVQNPCVIDILGFQVSKPGCRPPAPQRSSTEQDDQQPTKSPLCQGLGVIGFGIGATVCNTIAVPLPRPKTSAPSGSSRALAAVALVLAVADIGLNLLAGKNLPGKGPGIPGQGTSDPQRPTDSDSGRYQNKKGLRDVAGMDKLTGSLLGDPLERFGGRPPWGNPRWWIAGAIGAGGALLACIRYFNCSPEEQQEGPNIAPPSPTATPMPCSSRETCARPYQP